jgi:hypothetical protein
MESQEQEKEEKLMNKRRKRVRKDAGRMLWTERDVLGISWIIEQDAIRLDHLQRLLERQVNRPVSMSIARSVVTRWRNAGLVHSQKLLASEPIWIWPTRRALRAFNRPYRSEDVAQRWNLALLKKRDAMNDVRLRYEDEDTIWVSQRALRRDGRSLPDAERYRLEDEANIAVSVQLVEPKESELSKHLRALLRRDRKEAYSEVWFMAPQTSVRRQIREMCDHLLELGTLTSEEAQRIVVKGYDREDDETLEEQTLYVNMKG